MSNWNPRANEIFLHAAELKQKADREAYLVEQCAGDQALRNQVESLLVASAKAGSFMESPADFNTAPTHAHNSSRDATGSMIGPYKLLQKIGEGGMGSVWVAEQEKPVKRRVALKLIKTGMDSDQILHRFEAERQALAIMDHHYIAKVLDAGSSAEGYPYFVMELIKGVPITKYCDELHLTLRQRLELFIPVCQAIQHAHQKGIIHRDIKPSNILVAIQDGQPVPKIIDFGVAKALHQPLTEGTLMTEFGAVVGTLEYMSPEQAELSALDVDTRADVYALGVLLYELLTGTTPIDKQRFKNAAFVEMLRVIKEEEPPKPSTQLTQSKDNLASLAALRRTEPARLQKEVSGELDWIVMRCLEKDRTRRYESASALAQDVQRHLGNEPVLACPPSTGYRLKKWARRHRAAVIFASLVWLITLIALGFSTLQWVNAKHAEELAMAERDKANEARTQTTQKANELAQAVKDKSAALSRSEARRLATTAMMKASTDPDVTGPLVQEALALANDTVVASSSLAALSNLPRMIPFEMPTSSPQTPGFSPERWYTYHPDGKHVIVPCSFNEHIALFDVSTGKLVHSFLTPHHSTTSPTRIVVSPDGVLLFSLCGHHLYVCEIATGKLLGDFQHDKIHYSFNTAVVSKDGKTLAAIARENEVDESGKKIDQRECQIWLWNLPAMQGKLVYSTKEHTPFKLALSSDGNHLVAVQQGKSRSWLFDVKDGKLQWTKDGKEGKIANPVVAFSHDSKHVIELEEHRLHIRRCEDGETEKEEPLGDNFAYVGATSHVSADHRRLVLTPFIEDIAIGSTSFAFSQQPIRVFDLKELRWQCQIPQTDDPGMMVRVSANGERIVTLSFNQVLELWENGKSLKRMKLPGSQVQFFVLSPDGHTVVMQRNDTSLLRFELDEVGVLPHRDQAIGTWILSEDGRTIYFVGPLGQEYLETLDAATLKTLDRRFLKKPNEPDHGPAQLHILSQGQRALCTFFDGYTVLLDLATSTRIATHRRFPYGFTRLEGKLAIPHFGGSLYLIAHPKKPSTANFSPIEHELHLYESNTGKEIMHLDAGFPVHGFQAVDFSRDGRWLALLPGWIVGNSTPPREIQLWDTREKRLVEHIPYDSDLSLGGLALRADGQHLLAWSQNGSLYQWDRQTKWRRALSTRLNIKRAAISTDGMYVATYGAGELSLWDLAKDQRIYSIPLNPNETWNIQFTAGDTMLLAACSNKFHLWPLDLPGYLNKLNIPRLSDSQRHELGLIEQQK